MIFYLYETGLETLVEEVKALTLLPDEVQIVPIDTFLAQHPENLTHLIVSGSLEAIKHVIPIVLEKDITLGIIPTDNRKTSEECSHCPPSLKMP